MLKLQEKLKNGAKGYAPVVMWFTSGDISLSEMTYQIEGFKREGIEDYFIHPVDNTVGDYMGEYYFRMIRHAASEAKRLGVNYWIYDEYKWPSGIVGGKLIRDEPWTRMSALYKKSVTVGAGETVKVSLPSKSESNLKTLLFRVGEKDVVVKEYQDTVEWTNESDSEAVLDIYFTMWMKGVHSSANGSEITWNQEGYLDTLDREAVARFIYYTHEAYKHEIGEGFGKYVRGVFTDEVTQHFIEPQKDGIVLPWSRKFEEKFSERNGYDVKEIIPLLFSSENTDAVIRAKLDFHNTVCELFMDAFMGMTFEWCEKNNLIYTGHLLYEETLGGMVIFSGDPYEYYKRFTWPGIDTICSYYRIDNYNFNITGKLASSAARFHGKERVLSETYTISGWEIRPHHMKRIFNRLAVLGISAVQYMGARYDFMLAHDQHAMTNNWQNPFFKHYNEMSRYMSGIQWLIANTEYRARALLFYPLTTGRVMLSSRDVHVLDLNDATMHGIVNSLLHLHIPFEIGYEQVIDTAEVQDGKLKICGSEYDLIILPAAKYVRESTFKVIEAFAHSGGRVIMVNGKIEKVIGETIYNAPEIPNSVACENYEFECLPKQHGVAVKRAPAGSFTRDLMNAIGDIPGFIVSIEQREGIISAVRQSSDSYYVLIVNDSDCKNVAHGEVVVDLPFRAIDSDTGEIRAMNTNGKQFEIMLDAYECVVLEISSEVNVKSPEQEHTEWTEIPIDVDWTLEIDGPNTALPEVYLVHNADNIIAAHCSGNSKHVCDIAENLKTEQLVLCRQPKGKYNPIEGSKDYFGWAPVNGEKIIPGSTVVCVYDFTLDGMPESLELIGEPQDDTVWYLNGVRLYQTGVKRVWHYANTVFDLCDVVKNGKNRLVSVCTIKNYDGEFYVPVGVLKGEFRVYQDGILSQKPGGNVLDYWNNQGYYFHTGDAIYSTEFTMRECRRVMLEVTTLDVVEAFVNGRRVGKRLWEPYAFELTEFIVPGKNKLEIRVTSSLSNLLFTQTPSGISGAKLLVEEK